MQFSRTLVAAFCALLIQHTAGLAVPTPGYPKPTPVQGPENHTPPNPGQSQLPGPVPSSCPPEIAGYLHPPPTGSDFKIPGDFPAKYKTHLEDCIHKLHKRGNPDKESDCVNDLPGDIRKGKDSKIVHCVCQAVSGQEHPDNTPPKKTYPDNTPPKKTDPDNTLPKKTYPDNTPPKKTYPDNTPPKKTYPDNTHPDNTHPDNTYPDNTYPSHPPANTHPSHPPATSDPPAHDDKTHDY